MTSVVAGREGLSAHGRTVRSILVPLLLLPCSGSGVGEESVTELNKQLANPVSSLWSMELVSSSPKQVGSWLGVGPTCPSKLACSLALQTH